jgi:hypothetical protein
MNATISNLDVALVGKAPSGPAFKGERRFKETMPNTGSMTA